VNGPPDSPVIYSRTPPSNSREQQVRQSQSGAPDTVRCTQTEQTLAEQSHLISISIFSCFQHLDTIHLSIKQCTKSRNIPFDMICTLSTTLHRLAQKHLCWHQSPKYLEMAHGHISLSVGLTLHFLHTCRVQIRNILTLVEPTTQNKVNRRNTMKN
jgi:hypothetical protein